MSHFSLNLGLRDFFVMCFFFNIRKLILIDYLFRLTQFLDIFDTILIITLFLLASLRVCLLTLRLSINIKHLCLFFHLLPILTDFLKFNKNLRPVPLCIPLGGNIPLRRNSVSILFTSSERIGNFKFNFTALIQVAIETFWDPYI